MGRISEDAGVDYLESVGGNKKRVAKPSFLRNFQRKVNECIDELLEVGYYPDTQLIEEVLLKADEP
ncbi:MAG TPA: hypothetical protein ENF24_05710 [Methanosarcinales archaeon]|nr:hypothetical protein [Methanosarcinales archaeon]